MTNASDGRYGVGDTLWRNLADGRHFIMPVRAHMAEGTYPIVCIDGLTSNTSDVWLSRFEVTDDEAHAWAAQEFGIALAEARRRIDGKLGRMRASIDAARHTSVGAGTAMTPDAVPALVSLVRALPRAILDGLSGDPARVMKANGALGGIEQRLNAAGIAVDHRLSDFPYRIAALRAETARSRDGD